MLVGQLTLEHTAAPELLLAHHPRMGHLAMMPLRVGRAGEIVKMLFVYKNASMIGCLYLSMRNIFLQSVPVQNILQIIQNNSPSQSPDITVCLRPGQLLPVAIPALPL